MPASQSQFQAPELPELEEASAYGSSGKLWQVARDLASLIGLPAGFFHTIIRRRRRIFPYHHSPPPPHFSIPSFAAAAAFFHTIIRRRRRICC